MSLSETVGVLNFNAIPKKVVFSPLYRTSFCPFLLHFDLVVFMSSNKNEVHTTSCGCFASVINGY